ncbi:hypothetical protein S245_023014, partial [Arachis hypogaea]
LNLRSKYQLQSSSTFWQRNSTISKIFVKECMEPTCTKVMTGTALIRSNVGLVITCKEKIEAINEEKTQFHTLSLM